MTDSKHRTFTLQEDVCDGERILHPKGEKITVRKPMGGDFRGLQLNPLIQGDYNSLETIAPRITTPVLTKPVFALLDPADITQFGGELLDFLLPTQHKQAVYRDE